MLRRRVESLSESRPPSSFIPPSPVLPSTSWASHPHVSIHRSLKTVLKVYSPSVKVVPSSDDKRTMIAAFGNGDTVGGTVELDPTCSQSGRLSISIEGSFSFGDSANKSTSVPVDPYRRRHVFYSSCRIIPVSTSSEFLPARSGKLKGAFSSIRRRPSASSLNNAAESSRSEATQPRVYSFQFDLPQSCRSGEELPPTYMPTQERSNSSKLASSGSFSVEYKLQVAWEPTEASEYPSFLDVPIFYHSDADFQSVDCAPKEHTSWLEMPLRSDRPMPFRCAITLPTSVTFSRSSAIPYYVVFTTTPRSLTLTREIASDATISVTLVRKITVTEPSSPPPTPPQTPSTGDESDSTRGGKLLRRVVRSRAGSITSWSPTLKTPTEESSEKPLPRLPMQTVFSESRPLHSSICIGFPKRPRHQAGPEKHPSLDLQAALPDGLHKAKFVLSRNMLPSIDWSGVSVKYYLDVSVSVGQDDVRARVPIRVV